jgi:putative DNA primase/helicase
MGSLAFIASARAAWILVTDTVAPNKRLLLPLKNNLAQGVAGLGFTIESATDNSAPIKIWSPQPETSSVEVHLAAVRTQGRPDHERQHAIQWLEQLLSRGPRSARDFHEEAAADGISPRHATTRFAGLTARPFAKVLF